MFVIKPHREAAENVTKVLRRLRLYQAPFLKPRPETFTLSVWRENSKT
jgi:hypothetical protein